MSDCCQNNNIPIGPQGPAGTNGLNGEQGENGTNGLNGYYILNSYNSTTGTGTDIGSVETILYDYTIPEYTWSVSGDGVELYAYLEYFTNSTISIKFKLDGLDIYTYSQQDDKDETMIFKIKMSMISNTSQLWTIEKIAYERDTPALISSKCLLARTASAADTTTTNVFRITGTDGDPTAKDNLILYKATLYKGVIND